MLSIIYFGISNDTLQNTQAAGAPKLEQISITEDSGSYKSGDILHFEAQYDQSVHPSSQLILELNTGNTVTLDHSGLSEKALYTNAGAIDALAVRGSRVYAGDSDGGIWIFKHSSSSITSLGSFKTRDNINNLVLNGDTLYVANDGDGLLVLNVGDNASPTVIAEWETTDDVYDVALSNGYDVFVAAGSAGVNWMRIRGGQVSELAVIDEVAYGIEYYDEHLYIATEDGLAVYDISQRRSLPKTYSYSTPGAITDIQLVGTTLYAVGPESGFQIFDLSTGRGYAELLSEIPTVSGEDLTIVDSIVYLAGAETGIMAIDVSDTSAAVVAQTYDGATMPQAVAAGDGVGQVWVGNQYGLVLLQPEDYVTGEYVITNDDSVSGLAINDIQAERVLSLEGLRQVSSSLSPENSSLSGKIISIQAKAPELLQTVASGENITLQFDQSVQVLGSSPVTAFVVSLDGQSVELKRVETDSAGNGIVLQLADRNLLEIDNTVTVDYQPTINGQIVSARSQMPWQYAKSIIATVSDRESAEMALATISELISESALETETPAVNDTRLFNGGDGDGDGILDSEQAAVTQSLHPDGETVTTLLLENERNPKCKVLRDFRTIDPESLPATDEFNFPIDLFDFSLECDEPGAEALVTIILDEAYDTSLWRYVKYDPKTGSYIDVTEELSVEFVSHSLYNGEETGSTVTKIRYRITDGGIYDDDGLANGVIVDPSGPALLAIVAQNLPSFSRPVVKSSTVNGNLVSLSFNDLLDQAALPSPSAFKVTVNGITATVENTKLVGGAVVLQLDRNVGSADEILVAYESRAGELIGVRTDNQVHSFTGLEVVNITEASDLVAKYRECPVFTAIMRRGDQGSGVRQLQRFLNEQLDITPPLLIDGVFGRTTEQMVIRFQEKHQQDVLVDPWGEFKGTGYVYISTLAEINKLSGCGRTFAANGITNVAPGTTVPVVNSAV